MSIFHCTIKRGLRGAADNHAAYITRRGRHSAKADLVYSSFGNLPEWTGGDPSKLWKAADKYERMNGATYRELEIALPVALPAAGLIQAAERIVHEIVGNKPYQYAIHCTQGALAGTANPHVHIMWSDRAPDGIERAAEQMFSRYNPDNPERGGRRKDNCGRVRMKVREHVISIRQTVAGIENAVLEEHGHREERVDYRSLREQGVSRPPERHLGPARVRAMSSDEKRTYVDARPASPQPHEHPKSADPAEA